MQDYAPHSSASLDFIREQCADYEAHVALGKDPRVNPNVKRGLRNADGTGVIAGYTQVGSVLGYHIIDDEKCPMEGLLTYRGYNLENLVRGFAEDHRFGYEEIAYLLLFGELPTAEEYATFRTVLGESMTLPANFTEDMILKHPSRDVMNKLARSVLSLYSSDPDPDSLRTENIMRQSIELIAQFPTIIAHAYCVKRHYFDNDSLYLHRPLPELSLAENFLRMIRPDTHYTPLEARVLDTCMAVHAEHGGGNNSTFSCRVLSSSGTDTYSAIAAAIGSLKGPKHGGANRAVMAQFQDISANVSDWYDDEEVAAYLTRILRRDAGDHSGLVYGVGHAVYTLSDPRVKILKHYAQELAIQSGHADEMHLMEAIERLTPDLFAQVTGNHKAMCANVDLYSGLVYRMLGIPEDLYTALFAMARISGWCAHRIEEILTGGRIIRPAYKAIFPQRPYLSMAER